MVELDAEALLATENAERRVQHEEVHVLGRVGLHVVERFPVCVAAGEVVDELLARADAVAELAGQLGDDRSVGNARDEPVEQRAHELVIGQLPVGRLEVRPAPDVLVARRANRAFVEERLISLR